MEHLCCIPIVMSHVPEVILQVQLQSGFDEDGDVI